MRLTQRGRWVVALLIIAPALAALIMGEPVPGVG